MRKKVSCFLFWFDLFPISPKECIATLVIKLTLEGVLCLLIRNLMLHVLG